MGNNATVIRTINRLLDEQDRSVAWLARRANLPYKRVLSEVKHGTQPIKLETALAVADALGVPLTAIVPLPSSVTA